jgi:hypothetical protein
MGPGKCYSIPADLQSLDEVKRLVADISKKEQRKFNLHQYCCLVILI